MMTNKHKTALSRLSRLLFVFLISSSFLACTTAPSEEALRQQISALEAGIESGKSDEVIGRVADDFVGPNGMSRDELRRLVVANMLGNQRIQAQTGPVEVKMQGDTARATFTAGLSGGNSGWMPERAQLYQITTDWRYVDGEWLLIAAQWQPAM